MSLIDRLELRPREVRGGKYIVWSSEPFDLIDQLNAEDAQIIEASRVTVRDVAKRAVATVGDVFEGTAERISAAIGRTDDSQPIPANAPQAPAPSPAVAEGGARDALRRFLRGRHD